MFLGFHRRARADVSSKVVEKTGPGEKIGVIAEIDGRPGVVEYSDLDDGLREARDARGGLRFSQGSIAIHLLRVGFLAREGLDLPLHLARKRVRALIPTPDGADTEDREAVKFEMFIFDAIPLADRALFFEVDRAEEFAPLKNREGTDSDRDLPARAGREGRALARDVRRRGAPRTGRPSPPPRRDQPPVRARPGRARGEAHLPARPHRCRHAARLTAARRAPRRVLVLLVAVAGPRRRRRRGSTIPDTSEARLALREVIFAPIGTAARAAARTVTQPADGLAVRFQAERANGSLYLTFTRADRGAGTSRRGRDVHHQARRLRRFVRPGEALSSR